jgi:hypothetical protein
MTGTDTQKKLGWMFQRRPEKQKQEDSQRFFVFCAGNMSCQIENLEKEPGLLLDWKKYSPILMELQKLPVQKSFSANSSEASRPHFGILPFVPK